MSGHKRGVLGRRGAILLVALLGTMAGVLALRRGAGAHAKEAPHAAQRTVLESLPAGAVVAAELDLRALRNHPLTSAWFREPRIIEGLGDIATLCGADPLEQVERVAVAVPTSLDAGFAIVAQGDIDAGALSTCASRVILRREGKPIQEFIDGFSIVADGAVPGGARVAARRGGPLFLAEPAYLARAMRVLSSSEPSLAADPAHAALRRRVGEGVLVVTALLSQEHRATLASELERQGVVGSPLVGLASGAISASLGEQLDCHVLLSCDEAAAASSLGDLLRAELKTQAAAPLAKLVGYASLLERATVEVTGFDVHLRASLPPNDVLSVVRRVVALQRLTRSSAAAASSSPPTPASPVLQAPTK